MYFIFDFNSDAYSNIKFGTGSNALESRVSHEIAREGEYERKGDNGHLLADREGGSI